MRHLILVRHSLPKIVPALPGHSWHLSAKGHALCVPLAARLACYQPDLLVASKEPKAIETATHLSLSLSLPLEVGEGLHEHRRSSANFLDQSAFEQAISSFFEQPNELVFGLETAAQSLERFSDAIQTVLQMPSTGDVIVVAHATVISLFVAQKTKLQPYPLWQSLGIPSFVVLSLPGYELITIVEHL